MKKNFLLLLACSYLLSAGAQTDTRQAPRLHLFASLGAAAPVALRAAVEVTTKKRFSASLFGFTTARVAPNTPADYRSWNPVGSDDVAFETLQMAGFTVGKVFQDAESSRFRFNLQGGMTLGTYGYPVNFHRIDGFVLFQNYTYDWEQRPFVGFVFQPTFEFALSPYFGFSFSPFAQLNKYRSDAGVEAAVIFGYLRGQRPKQH